MTTQISLEVESSSLDINLLWLYSICIWIKHTYIPQVAITTLNKRPSHILCFGTENPFNHSGSHLLLHYQIKFIEILHQNSKVKFSELKRKVNPANKF